MEQALMDKLKNGTLDEIDKDMIAARIKNVDKQIETVLEQLSNNIRALRNICAEYSEEASLLGFTFVCAYDNKMQQFLRKKHDTYEENDAACVYALGTEDNIQAMCRAINRSCDEDERG
jgi:hypothetical protein